MISTSELESILADSSHGYKKPSDAFFADANKSLFMEYKKLGIISDATSAAPAVEERAAPEIYCNIPGCGHVSGSAAAYKTHYNTVHRYLCAECMRTLPTAHLLDLHISEQHDSFFAARVERGDTMYACFLEECKLKLQTAAARKAHCINVHKFPSNFRFNRLSEKALAVKNGQHKVRPKHTATALQPQSAAATKKTEDDTMATDDDDDADADGADADGADDEDCRNVESVFKMKAFSFGRQKVRSFHTKGTHVQAAGAAGRTLEDLNQLKQALDDV